MYYFHQTIVHLDMGFVIWMNIKIFAKMDIPFSLLDISGALFLESYCSSLNDISHLSETQKITFNSYNYNFFLYSFP